MKIDPKKTDLIKVQGLMAGSIAPRPIALASTINKQGLPNLSPFSFFNSFGVNPPILIFSPSRRGRDNSTKHTFENIKAHKEVVINVVTFDMAHQVNLSSSEYPDGINEFEKSGLSALPSDLVKPFRVKESPVNFECKVINIIETGTQGGAGNLVICEIVMIHVDEAILDENGFIDADKIDLVGRLGKNNYVRASGSALFNIDKPGLKLGIGINSLPDHIIKSEVLSGNEIGQIGMLTSFPSNEEILQTKEMDEVKEILVIKNQDEKRLKIHRIASFLIKRGKINDALKVLMTLP
ncbi:MAG: flavin reductase family protein [Bacteroidetes bacterium]|nr:flavin reductase family protein [Bacteroidota bacterium]